MDYDPFSDTSPWGEPPADETPGSGSLAAGDPGPAPFRIGITLKAAPGYEAEWLTPSVLGYTGKETAERAAELLKAMQEVGLIDLTSNAAAYVRGRFQGDSGGRGRRNGGNNGNVGDNTPKGFQNGRIVHQEQSSNEDSCPHGRTYREGTGRNGRKWAALMCTAPRGQQCPPLWKQDDGTFKAAT